MQAGSKLALLLVPLDTITWRAKQVSEFNNWEDILEFGIQILKLYAQFCVCSFRFCDYIDGKHLPLEKITWVTAPKEVQSGHL